MRKTNIERRGPSTSALCSAARSRRATPPLRLGIAAPTGVAYVGFLRRHLRKAHALLSPPLRELSLALVGDRRMAELHERFLGIPGPTDVLTFPLELDRRGRATSGEVVICIPEARRRARQRNLPVERELLLYAIHGMLHLSGFDDRTAAGFSRMHRTEDRILCQLGVGPVFETGARQRSTPNGKSQPRAVRFRAGGDRRRPGLRQGAKRPAAKRPPAGKGAR